MWTAIFILLMISVFAKLLIFAMKATWGITKIIFSLVVLPVIFIVLFLAGLMYFTIPVLVIMGIVLMVKGSK